MATPSKPSAAALLLLALVAAAALLAPATASTLTVFTGPGCSGNTYDVNYVCGCYDISNYQGGFHFVFTEGQEAYLYPESDCMGSSSLHLWKEERYCSDTGYKSVKMMCRMRRSQTPV